MLWYFWAGGAFTFLFSLFLLTGLFKHKIENINELKESQTYFCNNTRSAALILLIIASIITILSLLTDFWVQGISFLGGVFISVLALTLFIRLFNQAFNRSLNDKTSLLWGLSLFFLTSSIIVLAFGLVDFVLSNTVGFIFGVVFSSLFYSIWISISNKLSDFIILPVIGSFLIFTLASDLAPTFFMAGLIASVFGVWISKSSTRFFRGLFTVGILNSIVFYLFSSQFGLFYFYAALSGIIASFLMRLFEAYYTKESFRPFKIAKTSPFVVSLESVFPFVIIVSILAVVAYLFGTYGGNSMLGISFAGLGLLTQAVFSAICNVSNGFERKNFSLYIPSAVVLFAGLSAIAKYSAFFADKIGPSATVINLSKALVIVGFFIGIASLIWFISLVFRVSNSKSPSKKAFFPFLSLNIVFCIVAFWLGAESFAAFTIAFFSSASLVYVCISSFRVYRKTFNPIIILNSGLFIAAFCLVVMRFLV